MSENVIIYNFYPKKPKHYSEITLFRTAWAGFP